LFEEIDVVGGGFRFELLTSFSFSYALFPEEAESFFVRNFRLDTI